MTARAHGEASPPNLAIISLEKLAAIDHGRAIELAQAVHSGIYRENFPIAEEREPFGVWNAALARRRGDGPHMTFSVALPDQMRSNPRSWDL